MGSQSIKKEVHKLLPPQLLSTKASSKPISMINPQTPTSTTAALINKLLTNSQEKHAVTEDSMNKHVYSTRSPQRKNFSTPVIYQ